MLQTLGQQRRNFVRQIDVSTYPTSPCHQSASRPAPSSPSPPRSRRAYIHDIHLHQTRALLPDSSPPSCRASGRPGIAGCTCRPASSAATRAAPACRSSRPFASVRSRSGLTSVVGNVWREHWLVMQAREDEKVVHTY